MRVARSVAATAAVALLAGCTGTPSAARRVALPSTAPSSPTVVDGIGSAGLGDPYTPLGGNGGYDVASYDIKVAYAPVTRRLSGTATITATATARLTRFNLDLRGLAASAVKVNGVAARAAADGDELVITPAAAIAGGRRFVVAVNYGGVARPYRDPELGEAGFLSTPDGAIAIGEPRAAASWFPANDHPSDKATYTIAVTAPDGLEVLSNGVLTTSASAGGATTWTWTESAPMAPYLATVVIGHFRVRTATHDGRPVVTAVDPSLPPSVDDLLARTPEVVDYLASRFGAYPFDAMGGIVVADARVRFALENQTRPIYGKGFFTTPQRGISVIAHELAHQWFGDSLTVHDWGQVWLNEGFATYAQWLWAEDHGGLTTQAAFDDAYDHAPEVMWRTPPGSPPVDDLFSDRTGDSVYTRGAMTLHALRRAVGDDAFFRIVRTWAQEHAGGTVTTAQFVALAEQVAGRDLHPLFVDWLFTPQRPARPG